MVSTDDKHSSSQEPEEGKLPPTISLRQTWQPAAASPLPSCLLEALGPFPSRSGQGTLPSISFLNCSLGFLSSSCSTAARFRAWRAFGIQRSVAFVIGPLHCGGLCLCLSWHAGEVGAWAQGRERTLTVGRCDSLSRDVVGLTSKQPWGLSCV